MSVNAYLVKDIDLKTTENEIIIKKTLAKDSTFKLSTDFKIFEIFQKFGEDHTNQDCLGEITIDREGFNKFKNSYNPLKYTKEEKRIINEIESNLKDCEITFYELI